MKFRVTLHNHLTWDLTPINSEKLPATLPWLEINVLEKVRWTFPRAGVPASPGHFWEAHFVQNPAPGLGGGGGGRGRGYSRIFSVFQNKSEERNVNKSNLKTIHIFFGLSRSEMTKGTSSSGKRGNDTRVLCRYRGSVAPSEVYLWQGWLPCWEEEKV